MSRKPGRRMGGVGAVLTIAAILLTGIRPAVVSAQAPADGAQAAAANLPHPFPKRVKAPPLDGAVAWLNTAGPLELEQLKGKFVMLDFWTYCCINCMHILPELKKLEHAYPNDLVVIGVHSAKFDEEKDAQNIREAVLRYEIEHPVANDANHAIWNRYGVNSWPTMLLIDPEGEVVYARTGEFRFEDIDPILKKGVAYYKAKGTLDERPIRFDLESHKATDTPLRFPGKVLADAASKRLFISDSNHNRIVITDLAGKLLDVIGDGSIGKKDADFATSSFNHPQGMALVDDLLYICDTENHMLRKANLTKKTVETVAGTGVQAKISWPGMTEFSFRIGKVPDRFVGRPKVTELNSPWDLCVHGKDLYIAMAGPHQIWKMPLSESEIGPFAGNGREDIVDGPHLPPVPYAEGFSSFAQPSGLASDGTRMFVADSEGASIRTVPFDPAQPVGTLIGTSHLPNGRLFFFGDVDGVAEEVRLQHPIGVAYAEGLVYVADTYNNKIKQIHPKSTETKTVAGTKEPGFADSPAQFDEPTGVTYAEGKLYVADTNNHAIRVVDLQNGKAVSTLKIEGLQAPPKKEIVETTMKGAQEIVVAATSLKPKDGAVRLSATIKLPAGWKINPLAPQNFKVESAAGSTGPVDRAAIGKPTKVSPPSTTFDIALPVTAETGKDHVRITLNYYYCQEGKEGVCKVGSVTWAVPLTVAADGQEAGKLEIDVK